MNAAHACIVAMYHYVRDAARTPLPGLKALSPADFDAQLDVLSSLRRIVDFCDVETALRGGPRPPAAALLTFDDGVRDHYDIMPRLLARQATGVFFVSGDTVAQHPRVLNVHKVHVLMARLGADALLERLIATLPFEHAANVLAEPSPPELYRYDGHAARTVKRLLNYTLPIDLATGVLSDLFEEQFGSETDFARAFYLTPSMIEDMSRAGMTFGYHTQTHPVLSRLSRDAQRRELDGGGELIRSLTGQSSVPFCIPHGHRSSYDTTTLALLSELGYSVAFTAVREVATWRSDARLEVPRLDARDLPPFSDVAGLRAVAAST